MGTKKGKVLVVEDEAMVAMVMCWNLEKMGYEVCDSVATGEAAVASNAQHDPDIVLMDVHLPGQLSGIEAAQQIASERCVPFIFFTGYSPEEVAQRAGGIEPVVCLTKPVPMHALTSALETAMASVNDQGNERGDT